MVEVIDKDWLEFDNFVELIISRIKENLYK
jgi:hypothetical protein